MGILKSIVAVVTVSIVATVFCFGQSYSIVPSHSLSKQGMLDDTETLSIQQVNKTDHPINLAWRKLSESVPDYWEASVCDNSTCNDSLVESGAMTPVGVGEYGLLLVHVTPHKQLGVAQISYAVWDVDSPLRIDTLMYELRVDQASNVADFNPLFRLYPNPSSSSISITLPTLSDWQLSVVDANGKTVLKGNLRSVNERGFIDVESLASGLYWLVCQDQSQIITKTFIVQK